MRRRVLGLAWPVIGENLLQTLLGIVDTLLVARLGADDNGQEVVRAILTLARTLGKSMVAEGVETEEQLQQLIEMECEKGQGFFLGRPAPADEARQMIRDSALGRRNYPVSPIRKVV
jgi:predicted signal transduction protein with EAL and GGDEF domain